MLLISRKACSVLILLLLPITVAATAVQSLDLRIITEEMPPYNYSGPQGNVDGVATAIVRVLLLELDIKKPIEIMPWTRAYRFALNDPNVLIYSIARTAPREKLFHWLLALTRVDMKLYALPGESLDALYDINKVSTQTIGVLRDSALATYVHQHGAFSKAMVSEVVSYELIYKMNQRRRLDYFMAPKMFVQYLDQKYQTPQQDRPQPLFQIPDEHQLEIYLALSLSTPAETVQRVRDKLDQMTNSGKLAELLKALH